MEQAKSKTIGLYVVEEQEIYREVYKSILPAVASVDLLGITGNGELGALSRTVSELHPDVLLMSTKKLETNIIEQLEKIREDYPTIGIVLLLVFYNSQDIELLRRLALKSKGGMALFLKQSLDQIDQLCRTILAVSQGQVILDPPIASLMFAGKPECPFLKQLTARELEILSFLAQGYTNASIAATLFIDIKTVEHHLNSMYSKLRADPNFNDKHLRVSAARLYLATMSNELMQKEDSLVRAAAVRA